MVYCVQIYLGTEERKEPSLWAEKSWVKTLLQYLAAGKVTYQFMRYLASLDFSLFVCFLIYKMRLTMPFLEGFWEEEVRQ